MKNGYKIAPHANKTIMNIHNLILFYEYNE